MASISKRERADGSVVYRCEIKIKKHGEVVHREAKTFKKQKLARDWGIRRETELQNQQVYKKKSRMPISSLIDQYIDDFDPTGRSKLFDLNKLKTFEIAQLDAHALTSRDLIEHIKERNKTCLPQTAANDLVWLNTVLKTMSGTLNLNLNLSVFNQAREVLRKEGLIAHSKPRERRPTRAELWELSRYFAAHKPFMLYIMWFAVYSARRQSEITNLLWSDLDHDQKTSIVRDLKHPRVKGLHKKFKLPRSAYKIVTRQPRVEDRIFPYNSKTVGAYFTRACHLCGIEGLRFHDLRHEATSRLFEAGLDIVQVQQVTLHSSWQTLSRYTNLNPGDVDI